MEADTATSPEVVVLMAIAAAAVFWMFIWKTKTERRATRLIDWIWQNYPQAWQSLPWSHRNIFRERGLAELARRNVIPDPYFAHEYGQIAPFRRHVLIAAAFGITAIALILIGTSWFGWQY